MIDFYLKYSLRSMIYLLFVNSVTYYVNLCLFIQINSVGYAYKTNKLIKPYEFNTFCKYSTMRRQWG